MSKNDPTPALPLSREGENHNLPPVKGGLRGVFNRRNQKENRRTLRGEPTEPEKCFWQAVRGKQLGVKFRRQHGIGPYIVDFYCAEMNLVVELDGESHYTDGGLKYDKARDAFLQGHGLKVLRFTNPQIMQEFDAVLDLLLGEIEK